MRQAAAAARRAPRRARHVRRDPRGHSSSGGRGGDRARGRARHRQDAPARRARRARRRARALVLSGSASELERDLPFWVFVDALDEYAEGLDPRAPRAARRDARDGARARLPVARRALGAGGGTALQDERYRTHRAVRELLEALAAAKPLVLILDDLHWADSGIGRAARRAAAPASRRRPCCSRWRCARGRCRSASRPPSSARTAAGGSTRHELGALTPARDARAARAGRRRRTRPSALYEESGGNPFYLEQLARSLDRAPTASALAARSLARGRRGAARGRRRADRGARAALGRRAPRPRGRGGRRRPVRARADGRRRRTSSEAAAVDALDELLRRDLVRPTDVPRRFRFRHPLVRRAVYDAVARRLAPGRAPAQRRGARRARRARRRARPTTSSARRATATRAAVAVLREAGDAAAQRAPATRGALVRGGAAPRSARPRRPRSGSSC